MAVDRRDSAISGFAAAAGFPRFGHRSSKKSEGSTRLFASCWLRCFVQCTIQSTVAPGVEGEEIRNAGLAIDGNGVHKSLSSRLELNTIDCLCWSPSSGVCGCSDTWTRKPNQRLGARDPSALHPIISFWRLCWEESEGW